MPILNVQLAAQGQAPDGSTIQIPAPQVLLARGPVVQVALSLAQALGAQIVQRGGTLPPPQAGWALIDTGASATCIDDAIAQQMQLPVIDVVQVASASHAATQQNVYPAHLEVLGANVQIEVSRAVGAALASQGIIALIGRDVLRQCILHYNGPVGSFTLSI